VVLIIFGIGDTYSEKIKHGYLSIRSAQFESYYRTYPPDKELVMDRIDFKHVRQVNYLGFSDGEWPIEKVKNEKRVLCLGDSWTEGIGAGYDSTYVSILRSLLKREDTNYTVMNAGTAGDDPCVNFVNYRDRLVRFKPDVIIQTLSSNDMNTDIAIKGGMERFQKDGTVRFPPPPWWEPIYALSYVSRLFFHEKGYNELLIKEPLPAKYQAELNQKAIETFTQYSDLVKREGGLLIVVLQADGAQHLYDLSSIVKHLHTLDSVRVFDLQPYYESEFAKTGVNPKEYYWKHDGHHTPKGYALMAQSIKKAIDSFYINNTGKTTSTNQEQGQ
jgi:lysophospholipase L1-like esterase